MGFLSSFFDPGQAYAAAADETRAGEQKAQQYLAPWMQQGQAAGTKLSSVLSQLLDPAALQAKWMGSYQMSPQAQQDIQTAREQGLDAASAMGLGGSSAALHELQSGASQIAMHDRQQYMNDLMQKYLAAIGLGQGFYGTGAGMAGQAANIAQQTAQQLAGEKYGEEAAPGQLVGNLLGGVVGAIV